MDETDLSMQLLDTVARELDTSYSPDDVHLSDLKVINIDLSPLRLRLSAKAPCIIVTEADISRFGKNQVLDMARQELYVRQDRPGSSLILVENDSTFLQALGQDPHWAIILDCKQIQWLLAHPNPKRALLETLREQIPVSFLSPYEADQPVSGSQFYGRTRELNLILGYPDRSYTIEGGRRIGKTSLLKEAMRQMREQLPAEQHPRLVWYDFWGYTNIDAFLADVIRHFGEVPRLARGNLADYFPRYIKHMKQRHGGRITFFLDEIDDLIEHERRSAYQLLSLFKRIAAEDNCRCLFAGFRLLTEEQYRFNTPLSFCHRLPLANLTQAQARALLVEPMQNMGVEISAEIFAGILADSGGHPQLLQLYGQSLVEVLDRDDTRTVTPRHLAEIKRTGAVYDKLVQTLVDNTTDLEFALVCSLAQHEQFDMSEVDELLKANGIDRSVRQIQGICRSLEGIGVIRRQGDADVYIFTIPLQPALAARNQTVVEMAWEKAKRQVETKGV